jgi:hypothetical protein
VARTGNNRENIVRSYQLKEIVGLGALLLFLMASFPDHVIVIGVLYLVGFLALEDLSETAFLQAMLDDTIKRTTAEPVTYIIEPACTFKWLVWRQVRFMRPVRDIPDNDYEKPDWTDGDGTMRCDAGPRGRGRIRLFLRLSAIHGGEIRARCDTDNECAVGGFDAMI